jgi:hypothetical protein
MIFYHTLSLYFIKNYQYLRYGIGYNKINGLWTQSRTKIITPQDDNEGFAKFIDIHKKYMLDIIEQTSQLYEIDLSTHSIIIYGEWCGKGIQRKVAVCNLDKMFVIFAIKVVLISDKSKNMYINSKFPEISNDDEKRIYNIHKFKTYQLIIDFNNIKESVEILDQMIDEVSKCCPFSKTFGIDGLGEGIVFNSENKYMFKIKSEQFQITKTDKIQIDPMILSNINEFLDRTVTDERIMQAMENVNDIKDIIIWIKNDIMKEEIDVIKANNLDHKQLNVALSKRIWKIYLTHIAALKSIK